MSDKKQFKGRGFILVQVLGEIVHYGQKAQRQNQLRCGHRRLACQILVDQKTEKGNARTQQLSPCADYIQGVSGYPPQLIFLKKKFLKTYPKVCLMNDLSVCGPNKVNN